MEEYPILNVIYKEEIGKRIGWMTIADHICFAID